MKVLLAEDDLLSRRILESQLRRWDLDVVTAVDGLEADRILAEPDAPRLAIIDWMMPGLDGPEVCRRIRARGTEPYTYVLLLTSKSDKQDVVGGLDAGADDYIVKPFDPQELRVRLRAGERILDLQTQLILAREQMRDLALHDSLTGIWNRGATLDALTRELSRAQRERGHVGVIMVDIDKFKSINDTLGHPAGDAVLREVTSRFKRSLRPYDTLGRMGGEEFLILVPGCNALNAFSQAERLRSVIAREPVQTSDGSVAVTVSMGVSVAEHGDLLNVESLIRSADLALYRAKRAGRNRVEAGFTPDNTTTSSPVESPVAMSIG
ncbi:MAG: diguanylate cyclase [Planctomycetales bacterium]|nr:diguanylate cyclase [Planctomycetales bacterium]